MLIVHPIADVTENRGGRNLLVERAVLSDPQLLRHALAGRVPIVCDLFAKPPEDMLELCALLHEIGHCYFAHSRIDTSNFADEIKQEMQAWIYALRCIKPKYHAEAMYYCAWALASYFRLYFESGIDASAEFERSLEIIAERGRD